MFPLLYSSQHQKSYGQIRRERGSILVSHKKNVGVMAQHFDSDFEETAPAEPMKYQKTPSQELPEADQTQAPSEQLEQSDFDDVWPPCTLLVQQGTEQKPSMWVLSKQGSKSFD